MIQCVRVNTNWSKLMVPAKRRKRMAARQQLNSFATVKFFQFMGHHTRMDDPEETVMYFPGPGVCIPRRVVG